MDCCTRSPIVTYSRSWNVLSSPRVVRPTARVTHHRKTYMTSARITISTVHLLLDGCGWALVCSWPQPGRVVGARHHLAAVHDLDPSRPADLAPRLEVGVEVDPEGVPGR